MKALTSIFIFMIVLTGCSSEDSIPQAPASHPVSFYKKAGGEPANPGNGKDAGGSVYMDLLDAYYATPPADNTLQGIIAFGEAVAFAHPLYGSLPGAQDYQPISPADIVPYLNVDDQDIKTLLCEGYAPQAKAFLEAMTTELARLKAAGAPYGEAYSYLIAFETEVAEAKSISLNEADAILTTTSILRYGMYHDKKRRRRDRDWDWMTGNIAATANAALESQPQAILTSFATDVYVN